MPFPSFGVSTDCCPIGVSYPSEFTRARRPTNPTLVDIDVVDGGTEYIGWQTNGTLPILFNCEYDHEKGLFVSHCQHRSVVEPVQRSETEPPKRLFHLVRSPVSRPEVLV